MVYRDRKLVASEEPYEVAYFAEKHGIGAEEAREILDRAGRGRQKADALGGQGAAPRFT